MSTATERSTAGPGGLTHRQILVVMSGLMLAMFLASLDQTIVATALPTIVGDFHRLDLYPWVVTAYLLTSTASTPLFGKAGDLYGRKRVLQVAIVIFLAGSALCGAAQNMYQLVAFRGVQGIGAGGVMALVLAIIGDIIPPRDRGRYQAYFVSTFAASSVIGPLLGGFFVDQLDWRWVFFVNLPTGALALVVINRVLQLPFATSRAEIDWWGALLIVAGVSALVLAISTGGHAYAWSSLEIVVMLLAAAVLLTAFVVRERHAPEPILPMRLFRNDIFTVSSVLSFVVGASMFGVISYLGQYMQLVRGVSATMSGLLLLPMLVGMMSASILSGRTVSRTGHYRVFPIVGTATLALGLGLMSLFHTHMGYGQLAGSVFVFGAGMGLFMQVLVLATQNSVEVGDLGVATSANTFFRSLGGAIGAAAFGAVLTARLATELPRYVPGFHGNINALVGSPEQVRAHTTPVVLEGIKQAYTHSLHTVFITALPIALFAFALSWFLREARLRGSSGLQRAAAAAEETGQLSSQDRVYAAVASEPAVTGSSSTLLE
jgi:EmrB/QacA subfamily drug resistance transporter